MNIINIFSIVCSVSVYLIVIKNTFSRLYSVNSFFSFIAQNFLQYALVIELVIGLIAFSIIPCFYVLKKTIKKENYKIEENFISLIAIISAIPPTLAFINNIFTGNTLLSIALIIYGVMFAIIAFKFR